MAIPTEGDLIQWGDIEQWCTQDPVTAQWSGDATQIATWLNLDYRHVADTVAGIVWGTVWSEMEFVYKDVGLNPDPDADDFQWSGLWDDYHRNLPATGTVNQLLRSSWSNMIVRTPDSDLTVRLIPDYLPQETQQDDRRQRNGLVMDRWAQLAQELCIDPTYAPVISTQYKDDQQAVYDFWLSLTGGRRFGACTNTSVQAVIDTQNASESRNQAYLGTQDVRAKSDAANSAADTEYQTNPNATRASVNTAGDNAYNA